ncbi:MAG TPA: TROVE domain-containing protein [Cytophagales bacterium]|nr:TROVE domain-containing protein [Cytophagales bacterium]
MKTVKKTVDRRADRSERLAGGFGPYAAKQDPEALLRRAVLANLLWEDLFYQSGEEVAKQISKLVREVDPQRVFDIAVEARFDQKLRHVPLFIAREMAALYSHKNLVSSLLPRVVHRADELAEFMALYWKDGKCPLSKQVKKGLASAFSKFDEYQLAKYNRDADVRLRDVMFMCHCKPKDGSGNTKEDRRKGIFDPAGELFRKLAENSLQVPDTWEVALSTGKDKKETWIRLISEGKLGAVAFMRNLRNMEEVYVPDKVIESGFANINPGWLLPLNYLGAVKHAPKWKASIEKLMLRGLANAPKLHGRSIFVIDVSGSMSAMVSAKSSFNRLDAGAAMAILAREMCEDVSVYATAGSDGRRLHQTQKIPSIRGFDLFDSIITASHRLGGGGIFTRQCLEYIKEQEKETPDRIIVFSDSQDCDRPGKQIPSPFGKRNYIVDVNAHTRGINYEGIWTAEISGWSQHFLKFIAAIEGVSITDQDEVDNN